MLNINKAMDIIVFQMTVRNAIKIIIIFAIQVIYQIVRRLTELILLMCNMQFHLIIIHQFIMIMEHLIAISLMIKHGVTFNTMIIMIPAELLINFLATILLIGGI
jgi:hypothetical protein